MVNSKMPGFVSIHVAQMALPNGFFQSSHDSYPLRPACRLPKQPCLYECNEQVEAVATANWLHACMPLKEQYSPCVPLKEQYSSR
jgi:hypothetical protein